MCSHLALECEVEDWAKVYRILGVVDLVFRLLMLILLLVVIVGTLPAALFQHLNNTPFSRGLRIASFASLAVVGCLTLAWMVILCYNTLWWVREDPNVLLQESNKLGLAYFVSGDATSCL